jgi:membrane protease YdiL (CAAX protease family)
MNSPFKLNRVNKFLLLTFAVNWSIAGLFILIFPDKPKALYTGMAVLYMFIPALMAIVMDNLIDKKKSLKSLAINFNPNWWYIAAWPGVIIGAFLILGVNILWPTITFSPDLSGFVERMSSQMSSEQLGMLKTQIDVNKSVIIWQSLVQVLFYGITINAIAGFGEELGWRGFLVREYKDLKFWDASLRIGFIWGIWHAPIILMGHNYPQHPVLGVGMMIIWCMLLSPLFLYIRIKTHSVIGAAIMHGTLNASAGIPLMFIAGGNDLTAGATGFTGMIALSIIIGIMIAFDRGVSKRSILNLSIKDAVSIDKKLQSPEAVITE